MAIKNYLIEGVSASGKSTVCKELNRRGYAAVDGDKELAYNGDPITGEPIAGAQHENHIWDVEKLIKLVDDKNDEIMFFCGGSRNFSSFIAKFDGVFVLDVDDKSIIERLANRDQSDGWDKKPEEVDLVLKLNKTKEDIPRDAIVIDGTNDLDTVVDSILKLV